MTIRAFHRPLEDLMMKRFCKLRLGFCMAAQAQLGLACFQKLDRGNTRVLQRRLADVGLRAGLHIVQGRTVRAVTVGAADVVSPMLAALIVVVAFLARVTAEARLRNSLGVHILERDHCARYSRVLHMLGTRAVTALASYDLVLPIRQ